MKKIFLAALVFTISVVRFETASAAIDCSRLSNQDLAEGVIAGFKLDDPAPWARQFADDHRPERLELLEQAGNYWIISPKQEVEPGHYFVQLRFRDEGTMSAVVSCSTRQATLKIVDGSYSFPALRASGDLAYMNFPRETPEGLVTK